MAETSRKTPILILVIVLILICLLLSCLGLLIFLSYQTTHFYWDGGFPAAEFVIQVVDQNGDPIQDAWLDVRSSSSDELTYEFPVFEFTADELHSDDDGRFILHQVEQGIQFGGEGWDLLWIIPMGSMDEPHFTVTFHAEGYQPLAVDFWDLYQVGGTPVEMKEYEHWGMPIEMGIYEKVYRLSPSP